MKSDNRWQEKIVEEHRRIEELYGWLKPVAEIVEMQRRIDEQDRLLKSVAEEIKLKQQMESIASLTRVGELQRLVESSEELRLQAQVRTWLDHGLLDMLRLQEQVATIERAHLATTVRDDIRPAEIAFASFRLRCVAAFMATALRDNDREKVASLLEEFSVDYEFLQDIIEFSTCTEQQATQNLTEKHEALCLLFKELEEKLGRITAGTINRANTADKEKFKSVVINHVGKFKNIWELRQLPEMDWLQKTTYGDETLRGWLKEAIPGIKLSGGRRRGQKNSPKSPLTG